MKTKKLSDGLLQTKSQVMFMETAGFVIRAIFEPAEGVIYKRLLLENIENILGKSGFIASKKFKKYDFSFIVESLPKGIKIIEKNKRNERYNLSIKREIAKKKITMYYSAGLSAFFVGLQEILMYLIKDDGFIMHASGIRKKK